MPSWNTAVSSLFGNTNLDWSDWCGNNRRRSLEMGGWITTHHSVRHRHTFRMYWTLAGPTMDDLMPKKKTFKRLDIYSSMSGFVQMPRNWSTNVGFKDPGPIKLSLVLVWSHETETVGLQGCRHWNETQHIFSIGWSHVDLISSDMYQWGPVSVELPLWNC